MTDTPPASCGRSRHWLIDALMGGGVALALITAAHAALPRVERLAPQRPIAPRPAAPAEPPAFIAFTSPTPGFPVISPFGLRQLPWEEGGRLHAGVDIAAPSGVPVLAVADGVVVRSGVDGGYGRTVELRHAGGLSSVYGHLGQLLPQLVPGLAVKAGTPVGAIGSTGTSTGAHLHFEIRDDKGRPLNPELFLDRRFAAADDLPLRDAQRFGRRVRVAYVSNIPKAKREEMEAREEAELALAAAEAGWTDAPGAASATARGVNASATIRDYKLKNGRPFARLRFSDARGAARPQPATALTPPVIPPGLHSGTAGLPSGTPTAMAGPPDDLAGLPSGTAGLPTGATASTSP
ncbi:M23 family metallopeptidase [Phenylobacterium sp. LjRoot219]|uniref:M23 family metallopeptidase n=1 Tax=Phenylobacterium sp. LjRoot219 TaxID=3342283 RepID=UPI003ECE52EA